MSETPKVGSVGWLDLTVEDASAVRDFYREVVGWESEGLAMRHEGGEYEDYVMKSGDAPVAGVCHRRGGNANLPPVWLVYVVVEDLDGRLEACRRQGGEVVAEPRGGGGGRFAVIRDPAGAHLALYEAG